MDMMVGKNLFLVIIVFIGAAKMNEAAPMNDHGKMEDMGKGRGMPPTEVDTEAGQMTYFTFYQYMGENNPDPRVGEMTSREQFENAVKTFQKFAGISITGEIDEDTKRMMKMKRCGMPDMETMGDVAKRRRKRFTPEGSKWDQTTLTYKISGYTSQLRKQQIDNDIKKAFQVWSDKTPLSFVEQPFADQVDIDIFFAPREHGDGVPFDGPGSTLAHAFYPQYGGDAHFDDDEKWTVNSFDGINLFQVAAHEFGHSLGLAHSDIQTALMAPFYRGYEEKFMLHDDDVSGIQYIYGGNPTQSTPSTTMPAGQSTTTAPTRDPGLNACSDGQFDAVAQTISEDMFAFRGDYFYRFSPFGLEDGYPRKTEGLWGDLAGKIDAAIFFDEQFQWQWKKQTSHGQEYWALEKIKVAPGVTYFFQGEDVYSYKESVMGRNQRISDVFQGLPSNLDAAFVWSGNGKAYFTKGPKYYRVSTLPKDGQPGRVDSGYPKDLSVWGGLSRVDAVFQWSASHQTYFFKGKNYYRFNDQDFKFAEGYPKSIAKEWLGCESQGGIEDMEHAVPGMNHNGMDAEMAMGEKKDFMEVPGMMGGGADGVLQHNLVSSIITAVMCLSLYFML